MARSSIEGKPSKKKKGESDGFADYWIDADRMYEQAERGSKYG